MSVGFAVNCFERTYRTVLSRDYVERLRVEQAGGFDRLYLLVSNVNDRADAEARAGELDGAATVLWVADHLDAALRQTGLTRRALEPMLWYSAAPLVAIAAIPDRWLAYWDSDIYLDEPHDWITPGIGKLESDPKIGHVNPRWRLLDNPDTLDAETIRVEGDFAIGHNFSDQAFLVERERFARPVYRYFSFASLKYPTADHAKVFEQRADAFEHRKGLLRATYLPATYTHPPGGGSYPSNGWTPIRRRAVRAGRRVGARLPARPC